MPKITMDGLTATGLLRPYKFPILWKRLLSHSKWCNTGQYGKCFIKKILFFVESKNKKINASIVTIRKCFIYRIDWQFPVQSPFSVSCLLLCLKVVILLGLKVNMKMDDGLNMKMDDGLIISIQSKTMPKLVWI